MKFIIIILFALLVVVAGMYLLAKTKKEDLGRFFKFISYLVVISGFVIILLVIQFGIIRMAGHCKNQFMGMHHGCDKEMPFPPPCEHKMMKIDNDHQMIKKIEIFSNDKSGMMKMDGDKGCGISSCSMMKIGADNGNSMIPNCQLKCLSPEERAMVITKRISDKVTLTTEQFTIVQALILDISNKKNLLMNQSNDPLKLESIIKKHKQESLDAIKKLLTPAQIKLLPEDLPML